MLLEIGNVNPETDYLEYGLQLILSVLGASAAYFITLSNPVTFLGLLLIPILYGYTAYISREEFNYASFSSLAVLAFAVIGGLTAVLAAFYSLGNVLVSYFASGERFKDFYGSTSLPLLIIGVLIGGSLFAYGSLDPGFQDDLAEIAGNKTGELSGQVVSTSEVVENQKKSQMRLVNSTAVLSVRLASQEVMNETKPTPELQQAFVDAEDSVKQQVYTEFNQQFEEQEVDMSSRVEQRTTDKLKQMNFVLIIPIVAAFFYSLQPILGILTGILGKFLLLVNR